MDTRSKTDDNTTFAGEFGRPDYGTTPTSEQAPGSFLDVEKRKWCPPARRHFVALMAFMGFCNIYALRVDLSVAVIDMTKNRTTYLPDGTKEEMPSQFSHWNTVDVGIILSSFFYGYIFTQIPGGWMACKLGGKLLLGIGVSGSAVLALLTPAAAHMGAGYIIAVRILQGLFQGVTYPSMHAVWSHWAPPQEKTKLASFAVSGSYFGTVVALPISASLAANFGWASIFYFFGVVALIWSAFWILLVSETPSTDKKISKNELQYILTSLGFTFEQVQLLHDELHGDSSDSDTDNDDKDLFPKALRSKPSKINWTVRPPWKDILTSAPVWAIVASHFSENWGFYVMLTTLPSFLSGVYGFSMEQTGFLAALPFLVLGILIQVAGCLADYLRTERKIKTIVVRKVFNCTGLLIQAVFTLAAAHAASPSMAVACIVIAVGVGGFVWSAFAVNQLDIAPQYAGLLMGLSNCIATIPGIVGPSIVGALVKHGRASEWQLVFYISVAIYIFGTAVYGVFARAERQKWAEVEGGQMTKLDDEFHRDLDPANDD